jgi:hypothetical protein
MILNERKWPCIYKQWPSTQEQCCWTGRNDLVRDTRYQVKDRGHGSRDLGPLTKQPWADDRLCLLNLGGIALNLGKEHCTRRQWRQTWSNDLDPWTNDTGLTVLDLRSNDLESITDNLRLMTYDLEKGDQWHCNFGQWPWAFDQWRFEVTGGIRKGLKPNSEECYRTVTFCVHFLTCIICSPPIN